MEVNYKSTIILGIIAIIIPSAICIYFYRKASEDGEKNGCGCLGIGIIMAIAIFSIGRNFVGPDHILKIGYINGAQEAQIHKFSEYFDAPNGERLTYEEYKETYGEWYYNNTNEDLVIVTQTYTTTGDNTYTAVSKEIKPGEFFHLSMKPDYWFTELPHVVSIRTRASNRNKIKTTSKSLITYKNWYSSTADEAVSEPFDEVTVESDFSETDSIIPID